MTRVFIVADSGPVLSALTAAVTTVGGAYIVRHGSGRAPLDRLVASINPDLVVIGDPPVPADALARISEIRRASPAAKIVVLSSDPEATWLADALRADASAVLPGCMDPQTLAVALREIVAEPQRVAAAPAETVVTSERFARSSATHRRRRARRTRPVALPHEETAA